MRELGGPGRGHILLVVAVALVMMAVRAAAGEPYGSGVNADALANARIGGPNQSITSYGFRCTHTGDLASLRLYVIWSTRSGYSGEPGGHCLSSCRQTMAATIIILPDKRSHRCCIPTRCTRGASRY